MATLETDVESLEDVTTQSARPEKAKSIRDQFRSLPRGAVVPVDMRRFPDAPQEVYMRAPSGAQIAVWEQSGVKYDKRGRAKFETNPHRKAELIVITLCDRDGNLVFTTSKTDVKEVASFDAPLQNHLYQNAREVAGQVDDEDDEDEDEGN